MSEPAEDKGQGHHHHPHKAAVKQEGDIGLSAGAQDEIGGIGQRVKGHEQGGDQDLDVTQLTLCRRFADEGKPILGICKGAQVINVCFGGDIIQDLPDGKREHHSYHSGLGTGEYHETDIVPGSFLAKLYGEHVVTNSYHHQAIGKVGEGLEVLQKSDDGVIEFMAHESLPIYAVQWHPEKNCWDTAKEGVADGEPLFTYFAEKIRKEK